LVYGAENNQWITRFVDPLRKKFSSRINRRALLHISKLPAVIVYLATKLVYGPLNRSPAGSKLARHLFYNDYLSAIRSLAGVNNTRSFSIIWWRRRLTISSEEISKNGGTKSGLECDCRLAQQE